MRRSQVILLVVAISALIIVIILGSSGSFVPFSTVSISQQQEHSLTRKPLTWEEFTKSRSSEHANGEASATTVVTCQKSSSSPWTRPFGGAEGLLPYLKKRSFHESNSEKHNLRDAIYQRKVIHDKSVANLLKLTNDAMKQCRPTSVEAFQGAADALTFSSPGFFCPSTLNQKGISNTSDASKYQILATTSSEFSHLVTLPPQESNIIRKEKIAAVLGTYNSNNNKTKASKGQRDKGNHFICPLKWIDEGATVFECNEGIKQIERVNEKQEPEHDEHDGGDGDKQALNMFEVFDEADVKESSSRSLELVRVVKGFVALDSKKIGWTTTTTTVTFSSSSNDDDDDNNTIAEGAQERDSITRSSKASRAPASSSSSSSTSLSSPSTCLLEELSGAFLSQLRQNLLKERIDNELMLFSDAAYVVDFTKSLPPMINMPFFSNGRFRDSAGNEERVRYPQEYSDMTIKTGGFPTFEFSGSQPGLFVAIFTRAVVGFSYVFTCATGRMYGNGGSKEHRFEFAGSESTKGAASGKGAKASAKLPCRPLAAAFSRPPVRVAVPLCTSRYCRWYGIYHFMLEHLPQITLVLDVLTRVPGAVLVVTEVPSLTTRSLLVDALGIPANRIVVGPVRADVALLPTPGLVYRPLTHALRYFRRVILSRMGLDWRATTASNATSSSSSSNNINNSDNMNRNFSGGNGELLNSMLNPLYSPSSSSTSSNFSSASFQHFPRRFCLLSPSQPHHHQNQNNHLHRQIPEIRILFSERGAIKATAEQKQVRLPLNWQQIKRELRFAFPCARFQTEKEVREDVRDTIFAFYEADIVLGVHGANLLFTSFMRRGSHLIEMISADAGLNPRCFYNLAAEVGVKHSALLHDGAFKLQEYQYNLDPKMVIQRVNASIQDIVRRIKR